MPDIVQHLVELIRSQLALEQDVVRVANQNARLSPTAGLRITIGMLASRKIGFQRTYRNDPTQGTEGALVEHQEQQRQETYQVDIYSADDSARIRNAEIDFALNSDESEKLQARESFHIAPGSISTLDASEEEGARRLNRFIVTFNVIRAFGRDRVVEYFDRFHEGPQLVVNP